MTHGNHPDLFSIAKHQRGFADGVLRSRLPDQDAISDWWNGDISTGVTERAIQALRGIYSRGQWVACGCTGNISDPPLMGTFVRNGTCGIRRLTDRAKHAQGCVFQFEQKLRQNSGSIESTSSDGKEIRQPNFLEDPQPSMLSASKRSSDCRGDAQAEHLDPLARQLFWLLNHCNLDHAPMGQNPVALILEAAKGISIGLDLSLADILYCNRKAWEHAWMNTAFVRCADAGIEEQAILICPVLRASRKESWVILSEQGQRVPVAGRLAIYGDDASDARYPMLMYARILRRPGTDFPVIEKAYLHPVMSFTQWLLVDSNLEREAMGVLLSVCDALRSRGIFCLIEKPVFNWNNSGARPDFVLNAVARGVSRTLVIETMGSEDPVYAERKKDTVARLSGHKVFEDRRFIRDGRVNQRLFNFAMAYLQDTHT